MLSQYFHIHSSVLHEFSASATAKTYLVFLGSWFWGLELTKTREMVCGAGMLAVSALRQDVPWVLVGGAEHLVGDVGE